MPPVTQQPLAPFAPLVPESPRKPARRWGIAQLFIAPFRDVDHRVAQLAAATRAERAAREAATSGEAEPRR